LSHNAEVCGGDITTGRAFGNEVERMRKSLPIAPIKSHRAYRRALKVVEKLMTANRSTSAGDRLDALVSLIESWEAKHYPFELLEALGSDGLPGRPLILDRPTGE
jgi:hypothetical protein